MKKVLEHIRMFGGDHYNVGLCAILIFLIFFSIYVLNPHIAGDSFYYIDSISVLKTGVEPVGFVPMMIVSTYLGLRLIMFFDIFIQNIEISWLVLDGLLYITMGLFFYALLKRILQESKTALLGTLFLVTNYAAVTFGLGYLMDIGGWTAYIASLYFSYRYIENGENKWLYISAVIVGIGGLYKEYSFVACIVIFGIVLFKNWKQWSQIFLKGFITMCLAFVPFLLVNVYTYTVFNYTYIDWLTYNHTVYSYQNRLVEFIKSFGSIYNVGWFLFVGGLWVLLKDIKHTLLDKDKMFIWFVVASCTAVLAWPVVTRVLFITMPAVVIVSSLYIKKIKKHLSVVVPLLCLYIVLAYLMDAYVLNFVNLPF